MHKRIFHIAQDEKFVNSAIRQFEEVYPDGNMFFIIGNDENPGFKHVEPFENVKKATVGEVLQSVIPQMKKGDVAIFHSLAEQFYKIIQQVPEGVKLAWFCYGYEVYADPYFFSEKLLQDKITAERFPVKGLDWKARFREFLMPYQRLINPKLGPSWIEVKKSAMKKMDYLASSFDEEFNAIQKLIGLSKKNFNFWCYPIESMVDMDHGIAPGNNILVGNSGHISGNHLDVFEKIKAYKTAGEIIVPLSYGNPEYIDKILAAGKEVLGQKFHPLTDFYPLNEYNQILSQCGIAIFNSRRQQAVGNTIALIWYGSKIFLSSKNPFYRYLKRIGVAVFSYEDDLSENSMATLLSHDEIAHNRKMLLEHLNRERLKLELKASIDEITNGND